MKPRASEAVSGTKPPVRIAVDMDEVIADYFGEQVARYESWSGAAVDISATEGKRLCPASAGNGEGVLSLR